VVSQEDKLCQPAKLRNLAYSQPRLSVLDSVKLPIPTATAVSDIACVRIVVCFRGSDHGVSALCFVLHVTVIEEP
jgi:hypothetical protein